MDIDIISIFNPPKKDENEKIKDLNGFRKPSQITKRTVVNASVLFRPKNSKIKGNSPYYDIGGDFLCVILK